MADILVFRKPVPNGFRQSGQEINHSGYQLQETGIFGYLFDFMINLIMYIFFQILKLKDDGEVSLDWLDNPDDSQGVGKNYRGPILLFLPGLTGHSQSEYIKCFINIAHKVCRFRQIDSLEQFCSIFVNVKVLMQRII